MITSSERPNYLSYDQPASRSLRMILGPLSIVVLCLALVGGALWGISAYKAPAKIAVVESMPSPSPSPVDFPTENSVVKSPLRVSLTVPAGWAHEGSVPIQLADEQGNVIARGTALEVIAGSWTSGKPIRVIGQLNFATSKSKGYFTVSNDNPSGLPENAMSYRFSVRFSK